MKTDLLLKIKRKCLLIQNNYFTGSFDLMISCLDVDPQYFTVDRLSAQNNDGDTVLHQLSKCRLKNSDNCVCVFQKLLDKKAKPNLYNKEGKQAIHYLKADDKMYAHLHQLTYGKAVPISNEGICLFLFCF